MFNVFNKMSEGIGYSSQEDERPRIIKKFLRTKGYN